MKNKINILLIILLFGSKLIAQKPALVGQNMLRNEAQSSIYLVLMPEEKKVTEDLENYVKEFGRLVETDKHSYKISNVNIPSISSSLRNIEVLFEESRNVLRVCFFFEDDKGIVLNNFSYDSDAAKKFVQDFSIFTDKRLSKELAAENLKIIEDKVSDAQRDIKKIEKKLETNLKYQEKYGKVLDSTPELLAQALSEKEELVGQLYSDSSQVVLDAKSEEELKKQATKKEKEIVKLKKNEKKNASRLDKKEREFDDLKNELFEVKKYLKNIEKVEFDTKSSVLF